ncbi:MAG: UDP-2,3-diacylglucosamine diphosphatase [Candidatus Eisenbacteria bacterium]|uniref:UDP-2,3-diacylglucosamine diphosphatase n=1 Tax=Eiseniibacteriota bacterium TaxID=2212470 RepID=A0A849SLC2_UNCEI|nr:UDP-2,3-diacylglucosamine diphosphatase [Candidatus Eisenbacteria bacterium]
MPSAAAVYFLSDAHLGVDPEPVEAPRRARLHAFLKSLSGRAQALYIVGDLFDFWFEYGTAIPRRHFGTLRVLAELKESGVEIHYLNGNHDFWLGPFLSQELGVRTYDGAVTLETQGRRVWMHHGDGLVGGDLGYRALKRLVRHPVSIELYRLLHPDLGIPLAHWVSNGSRRSRPDRPPDVERLWREIALPRFEAGFDTVMIGHFHQAIERRDGSRAFFVLGDWMEHFTFVKLEGGELELGRG